MSKTSIILLDDDPRGLLHRLRPHATLKEEYSGHDETRLKYVHRTDRED